MDEAASRLFPVHIREDPWILYHGTSNLYEERIDSTGLLPKVDHFSLSEIQSVLNIFVELNWDGMPGSGSRSTLEPFTLNYDLSHAKGKPVYLAESANRALVYASAEMAGGEAAYAVRASFRDFDAYLSDATVRQKHFELVRSEIEYLTRMNASASSIPSLPEGDLAWLKYRLHRLNDIRRRADGAFKSFQYGVIYAIRFEESDLTNLEWAGGMGVLAFSPISKPKLVSKAIVTSRPDVPWGIDMDAVSFTGVLEKLILLRMEKHTYVSLAMGQA